MGTAALAAKHKTLEKALLDATQEVFTVQLQTPIAFEARSINSPRETLVIKTMLTFTGTETTGFCALGFSEATFCKLYTKLLGEACTTITDTNADSIAKILNMVFGVFKAKVNNAGHGFAPAIPVILRDPKNIVESILANGAQEFNCKSALGIFSIEFHLRNKNG